MRSLPLPLLHSVPSLTAWAPECWPVAPDWQPILQSFWASACGQQLAQYLQQRLATGATIYPATPLRALELTALADVRVVILGQDPYHGPGQAEGLAFSVPPGIKIPPSLRNIFKELLREYGGTLPTSGHLQAWAQQGVLLLNTVLTVEQGAAASHAQRGWESLTDRLLAACNADPSPKAFLLWGAHAQAKQSLLDAQRHLVLCANHPSPLSANRPPVPFIGCGHFQTVNAWLQKKNQKTIAWLQKPEN
ncbi:MAG: uracil-DNA glycosylase [Macromonas sp.]